MVHDESQSVVKNKIWQVTSMYAKSHRQTKEDNKVMVIENVLRQKCVEILKFFSDGGFQYLS